MAQHYRIYEKDEPKLFRSAQRIAKYLMRYNSMTWNHMKAFEKRMVYQKLVQKLTSRYPMGKATKAFSLGPYYLEDKYWDQRTLDGLNLRRNAYVEVHTDNDGCIIAIYYPI